jgi:hypothetical protein
MMWVQRDLRDECSRLDDQRSSAFLLLLFARPLNINHSQPLMMIITGTYDPAVRQVGLQRVEMLYSFPCRRSREDDCTAAKRRSGGGRGRGGARRVADVLLYYDMNESINRPFRGTPPRSTHITTHAVSPMASRYLPVCYSGRRPKRTKERKRRKSE